MMGQDSMGYGYTGTDPRLGYLAIREDNRLLVDLMLAGENEDPSLQKAYLFVSYAQRQITWLLRVMPLKTQPAIVPVYPYPGTSVRVTTGTRTTAAC